MQRAVLNCATRSAVAFPFSRDSRTRHISERGEKPETAKNKPGQHHDPRSSDYGTVPDAQNPAGNAVQQATDKHRMRYSNED
jgi:hypothetical protein